MSAYTVDVVDRLKRPIPGVKVYIYEIDAVSLATITPENPLTTDADGLATFTASDGFYVAQYDIAGTTVRQDVLLVGLSPIEQATGAATSAHADAITASAAATTATTQAGIATSAAGTATAAATTATTQAGISTAAATTATTQAGIATTQAGIATTQAGIATTQAGIATTKATEAAASAATVAGGVANLAAIYAAIADLPSAIQAAPGTLMAGQAASLTADRMLDPAIFIDNILGVDAGGYGSRPYKPVATFGYVHVTNPTTDGTILLRSGQQHMVTPPSDGNGIYIGFDHRTNIASYGGEGNYGACMDTRLPLAGQTWTASGSGWTTTVTLRNSLDFTGAANIAGIHLMLWHAPEPHDDVLGTLAELKIGNANPAANDAAVDAASGVTAWSIKYSGQTAGDIRGTGHAGDTYILRVKMADGSDPNDQPLFLADYNSGVVFVGGSHGHVLLIGTTSKDSATFAPTGGVSLGLIPWFESLTVVGTGGHGGVGPRCTIGDFTAIGVPIPGEATYATGQTGGGGCHNFSAGYDLSNQYLYNGSIHTKNFAISGCYTHGGGGGFEQYRGWNVAGDIVQDNCTSGFEIEVTLVEGFKHAGRLILTNGELGLNSYPGQYFQIAGAGGLFKPKASQAILASFTGGGERATIIGSDDPTQVMVLDASLVVPGAPHFYSAALYARNGADSDPAPSLTLKHVEDITPLEDGQRGFLIPDVGFNANNPYVNLTLIGTKLWDVWRFDFAPHWPSSLYVDGNSRIGFFGRTWAEIEAAYAALGWPCTILPGAQAVDATGAVIDTK